SRRPASRLAMGGRRLFGLVVAQQFAPFAVLLLGRAGEAQAASLDIHHLRGDLVLERMRQLAEGGGVSAGVRVFLQARDDGGHATDRTGVARRALQVAGGVAAATTGREDGRGDGGRAEEGARPRLRQGALLLVDLVPGSPAELAVRQLHLLGEAG